MANKETTWFDDAAFDIFLADGGVDNFDDLTEVQLTTIVTRELQNFVSPIVEAAIRMQERRAQEDNA